MGVSPFVMELHQTQPIDGQYAGSRSSHEAEAGVVGKKDG